MTHAMVLKLQKVTTVITPAVQDLTALRVDIKIDVRANHFATSKRLAEISPATFEQTTALEKDVH